MTAENAPAQRFGPGAHPDGQHLVMFIRDVVPIPKEPPPRYPKRRGRPPKVSAE